MKSSHVGVERIVIPDRVERPGGNRVDDDVLRKSIKKNGIQQPLVLVRDGDRLLLADGWRRLRLAKEAGAPKVPCVIDEPPSGVDAESHVRRLRFILDQHRQDLLPTQKADFIETLKKMFGFTHVQIAAYLGIDQDSVTNWLAVRYYIEPVRQAVDAGALSQRGARVFDGMSEAGQQAVWKRHQRELANDGSGKLHKAFRAQYSPEKFPTYYREPEKIAERLKRTKQQRKAKPRPAFTTDDKRRLMQSYEIKEQELIDLQNEQKQLKAEINAAIPIVAAIRRSEKLWAMVPVEMRPELERFCEIYV